MSAGVCFLYRLDYTYKQVDFLVNLYSQAKYNQKEEGNLSPEVEKRTSCVSSGPHSSKQIAILDEILLPPFLLPSFAPFYSGQGIAI